MREKNRIQKILLLVLMACGIFLYFYLTWGSLKNFVQKVDPCEVLFCDFVIHYYPTAQTIFKTELPLNGFVYSPFFAMLTSRFAQFPSKLATMIWGGAELLLTLLLFLIPYRTLTKSDIKMEYLYILLFFTSLSVIHNFKWGQVSVLMAIAIIAAFLSNKSGRSVLAGVLLGIGTSIKYYPGIFVFFLLFRREKYAIISFLITCLSLLIILPIIFLGVDGWLGFVTETFNKLSIIGDTINNPNSQYFPYVMLRLFEINPARVLVVQMLRLIGLTVALFNIILVWFVNRYNIGSVSVLSISLLFCTLPFVLETSWHHYFVFLPFVQISLLWMTKRPWMKFLVILSMILSSIFLVNLFPTWNDYTKWGFSFLSTSLILISIYLIIFEAYRKQKGIIQ